METNNPFKDWINITHFMKSKLIDDWPNKGLTCYMCGKTRSVKYMFLDKTYCNGCIMRAKEKAHDAQEMIDDCHRQFKELKPEKS
jgi:hypothetical protein